MEIRDFIKQEIKTNDYYEKIKEEYSKGNTDRKRYMEYKVYDIFLNWYDGYYSVWTILDTIENYMEANKWTFEQAISYENFCVKDY